MRSVALTCLVGVAIAARSERSTSSLGVLGLGSNVVDRFYKIRGPGMEHVAGQKGYFASAGEVVGGVTLNHLSWARSLGVPSALAALQGDDESGRLIREAMATHGVSTDAVTVEQSAISSVSHVIIDSAGERTILMAPHATATIDDVAVERLFSEAVSRCAVVTTEVSQVPLSGVAALLQQASARGVPSVLDVDVPPSVAAGAAQLCAQPSEVLDVARLPTMLKVTRDAATELLQLADAQVGDGRTRGGEPAVELARRLQSVTGVQLVAVTAGGEGGALASASGASVHLPPASLGAGVMPVDTTGAGDAFLGGLLAALWQRGLGDPRVGAAALPSSEDALIATLAVANAAGAACCGVLGGLPPLGDEARSRVCDLLRSTLPPGVTDVTALLPPPCSTLPRDEHVGTTPGPRLHRATLPCSALPAQPRRLLIRQSGREACVQPSLLAADVGALADAAREVEAAGASWVHVDVTDGSEIAGLALSSLGPSSIAAVRRAAPSLNVDVHLYVSNPEAHIERIAAAGAHRITFQLETIDTARAGLVAAAIRRAGCAAGVCIAPDTDTSAVAPLVDAGAVELVDVLAVLPGWGGQAFQHGALDKLRALRARHPDLPYLMTDGGIDGTTAPLAAAAGSNVLVSGSFLFAAPPGRMIDRMVELEHALVEHGT